MTFESVYCPQCARTYPRIGSGNMILVPCSHRVTEMIRT